MAGLIKTDNTEGQVPVDGVPVQCSEEHVPGDGIPILDADGRVSNGGVSLLGREGQVPGDGVTLQGTEGQVPGDGIPMLGTDKQIPNGGVSVLSREGKVPVDGVQALETEGQVPDERVPVLDAEGQVSDVGVPFIDTERHEKNVEVQIIDTEGQVTDSGVPIDREWAWIVLVGCTVQFLLFVGTIRSFGVFFVEYLEEFDASASMASLITGCQTATYSLFALPVLTFGLRIISVRQCVMIGAFLCSLSYGLNSLATNIQYLIVTQGIIFGAGSGFMFSTSLILIGRYFKKYRGLANGIAVAGCSLGGLVFPPIYSYILNTYGLYGGMIVTSGILLNIFVAAALLRPPSFYETRNKITSPRFVANETPMPNFEMQADGNTASSLPMLVLDNQTLEFKNMQKVRSRTFSENVRPKPKIKTSSSNYLEKLSNSNLVRYLSHGELSSSFMIIGSTDIYRIEKETSYTPKGRCENFNAIFSFDTSLFKSSAFNLTMAGYCFGAVPGGVGFIYIPPFAVEQGIDIYKAATLLSIIGATDFIGRILSGFLSDRKYIKSHYIIAIASAALSIMMHIARFCTNIWTLAIFSGFYGLFAGVIISLNPITVIEAVGLERYSSGMAINSVLIGLALGVTAPFLGFLRDYTDSYHMTFHYIGIATSIAVVIYVCIPFCLKRETKRNKSNQTDMDI